MRAVKIERGASPRVVSVKLIGSEGVTSVDGGTLQERLGLRDRWVTFKRVGGEVERFGSPWRPS